MEATAKSATTNTTATTALTSTGASRTLDDIDDNDQIDALYEALLDHLLMAPQRKEELMRSQTIEKKKQMLSMHKQVFEPGLANTWGEKENSLLQNIQKAKTPDLQSLSRLRVILSSANREFMTSFLDSGGVTALLRIIEARVNKQPLSELDVAVLYEIVTCCKAVMNNQPGMDGFLAVDGTLEGLARCLSLSLSADSDHKALSLLLLEILSVIAANSEKYASYVLDAVKQQQAFISLSLALIRQDVELQATITIFVNSLILHCLERDRHRLRHLLSLAGYDQRLEAAEARLERELLQLEMMTKEPAAEANNNNNSSPSKQQQQRRQTLIAAAGPRASVLSSANSTNGNSSVIGGLLCAAKAADKINYIDMLGGKKTKRRWYELDSEAGLFRWCAGHEKEVSFKGEISVSQITEIRPYSTDTAVCNESNFSFEIETPERNYALGAESAEQKESWLLALSVARDNAVLKKGTYRATKRELSTEDIIRLAAMVNKQAKIHRQLAMEEKRLSSAVSLDLSDLRMVSGYLCHESEALTRSDHLLRILHELLLVPITAYSFFESTAVAIAKAREGLAMDRSTVAVNSAFAVANITAAEPSVKQPESIAGESVAVGFNYKVTASGQSYLQLGKLAMAAMRAEQLEDEKNKLLKRVEDLTAQLQEAQQQQGRRASTNHPVSKAEREALEAELAALNKEEDATATRASRRAAINKRRIELAARIKNQARRASTMPVAVAEETTAAVSESTANTPLAASTASKPETTTAATDTATIIAAPAAPAALAVVEEEEKFIKYRRMIKAGLPEGAVRQKMSLDSALTPTDIESFFNPATAVAAPPPAVSAALPIVDEKFVKFDKMRKAGLPEGAIRQKMSLDGLNATDIDHFFSSSFGTATTTAAATAAVVEVDMSKFERFAKMKKAGLPEGAIRQKMNAEGFSAVDIDLFFGVAPTTTGSASNASNAAAGGAGLKPKAASPALPPPVIEEGPPPGMKAKVKSTYLNNTSSSDKKVKLKGLFWSKIPSSQVTNTIWMNVQEPAVDHDLIAKVEEWFGTTAVAGSQATTTAAGSNKTKGAAETAAAAEVKLVNIVDSKRTQSILILLGKLRRSPEDLSTLMIEMDPTRLDSELTLMLMELLPTAEELVAITPFISQPQRLELPSRWILACRRVPRLPQRLTCHSLCFTWFAAMNNVHNQLTILERAVGEVKASEQMLRALLGILLAVGNTLNGNSAARGLAYGVKIDVLTKASVLKGNQPSMGTLLHLLAVLAMEKAPNALQLSRDWTAIWAAADLSYRSLLTELTALDTQINTVNSELLRIKDGRENEGLDGLLEDRHGPSIAPLQRRLDTFLISAKPKLAAAKQASRTLESSLEGLLAGYGESLKGISEDDPSQKFFSTLATFARGLTSAAEEIESRRIMMEKEKEKEREKDAAAAARSRSNSPIRPRPSVMPSGTAALGAQAAAIGAAKGQRNLFQQFHSAQEKASAGDVVAEFKSRLAGQASSASAAAATGRRKAPPPPTSAT